MSHSSNNFILTNVAKALSETRLKTFQDYYGLPYCIVSAMNLYSWNGQLSSAFMLPLHICEVVIRNAVNDVLTKIYGERWPWERTFELTLPSRGRYNPRSDLINARRNKATTGKVIPELKFVFWQKMFTSRHSTRIWDNELQGLFPNGTGHLTTATLLSDIYDSLESIRLVRNRIAHHEHLINRNLSQDYSNIIKLISYRCADSINWLHSIEQLSPLLARKPERQQIMRPLVHGSHYQPVFRDVI
ncbi:hypothetical protein [Vibrio anguillarum]|uniref:hypothetical protein n=1 Tax=Vibrio anguillarum TaxID=55601 RepID=UPI0019CFC54E|nr:hypothetical protein [Vibrio anguillarum]